MSLIAWLIIGLIAGVIGGKVSGASNQTLHIIIGIAGAVVGGWLFFGHMGTGLNLYSLFFSIIGSIVALVAYQKLANPRKRI